MISEVNLLSIVFDYLKKHGRMGRYIGSNNVLYKLNGVAREELERTRAIKEIVRDSFSEKIFLEYVEG